MKNNEITRKALNRAERWYEGALRAFEDQRWDDVIYSYEMAVEQALKGILILYGIEYPKKHDISNIFLELKNKNIPDFYVKKIDDHSQVLKTLVDKRGPAAYGYIEGYDKEDFKKDARDLKSKVKEIIKDCRRLLNEFNKKGTSN